MSGLKDFQQATVNRIDALYHSGKKRVLVSDEVGLGKTLIAKGTIVKLAKRQKEADDDLVKVVYVCSNSAIAGQNLEKLMISNDVRRESTSSSRLSMQHLNIFLQENDEL
jgi:superfamily II DNA or RNA helicase